jgi:translation initiation factor 2 subunit 1
LIENAFGDLYDGLEKTAKDGVNVLLDLGIDKYLATTLEEIAKEKIQISLVNVKGILELQSPAPKGVLVIKESLNHAKEVGESEGAEVSVYLVSPPNYRIVVEDEDYKSAENVLEKATTSALEYISKSGGKGSFQREK